MYSELSFNTDNVSREELDELKRMIAFDMDISDIAIGKYGYTIEIYEDLKLSQIVGIIRELKGSGMDKYIDGIKFNSME